MGDMDDIDALRGLGVDVLFEDAGAKDRARQRLRRHSVKAGRPLGLSGPRRGVARWVLAATAVVGVVAVAQAVLRGGDSGIPAPSATETLRRLALVAARQPNPVPPPGKYVYVRSEQLQRAAGEDLETGESWTAVVRVARQSWRAADGSGRILTLAGKPRFVSASDEAAWRRAGRPEVLPPVADDRYRPGSFPTRDLTGLPLDVTALRRVIEGRSVIDGPPGVAETLSIIGILLAEEKATPSLRASLLEVAASLRGVEIIRDHRDPLGRGSVAVALSERGRRTILSFAPGTAALLSTERSLSGPGSSPPTIEWQAFWPPRIVSSPRTPGV
jgi:hypothetical protein